MSGTNSFAPRTGEDPDRSAPSIARSTEGGWKFGRAAALSLLLLASGAIQADVVVPVRFSVQVDRSAAVSHWSLLFDGYMDFETVDQYGRPENEFLIQVDSNGPARLFEFYNTPSGPGKSIIHSDATGIRISWVEPDPDPSVGFRWRFIRSIPYTSRSTEIRFSIPLQDLQDSDGTFWYLLETLSFGDIAWDEDEAWITNVVHAPGHVVLGNDSVPYLGEQTWEGMATTWQAGGESRGTLRRVVALTFNQFEEIATLQMDEAHAANASDVRLHCASAGESGPLVWAQSGATLSPSVSIQGRDLTVQDSSSACGRVVNNISSLRAAAQDRRLYVELTSGGAQLRAQLWPKHLRLQDQGFAVAAALSEQQTVPSQQAPPRWERASASLRFTESSKQPLHAAQYTVPYRQRFLAAGIYCGPPGVNGDLVADLQADTGLLVASDLLPTNSVGPCGMQIDSVATLLEAVLRGNVYVQVIPAASPERPLRGQFPRY